MLRLFSYVQRELKARRYLFKLCHVEQARPARAATSQHCHARLHDSWF